MTTAPPRIDGCPKRMMYGPCGGVRSDSGCEMRAGPCVFPEPVERASAIVGREITAMPRVLTDLSAPPFEPDTLVRISEILTPTCDALLVGEHQNRPDLPPSLLARILLDAGARPWITLACRDRNRIVLEQELRGLRHVGVDAVLCVTGDGRAYDVRPDVTQVFDLDGPRLTELAARVGLSAAVAETPLAPPVAARARRLVVKQNSGASVAVLNHVPRPADVATFVAAARSAGLTIPVVAAVAVYTDEYSAAALQGLPGIALDPTSVRRVLTAADPVAAGIDTAVRQAREMLAIEGVDGVNLSGAASERGWVDAAHIQAEIGRRLLAGLPR